VRAALGTAQGYVYKTDFRRDFLPAVQAVLRGQQFVSSSLKGYELTGTSEEKAPRRHELHFYSDDAVFLDSFAHFVVTALNSGRAAIAVITESHRSGLVSRLKAQGLDVDAATQQGTYIQLDVAETLSTFMVNGMPDATRLFEVAGGLIETAAKAARQEHDGVVVCGECSPTLWAEGKADAAIRRTTLRPGRQSLWAGHPLWVCLEQLSRRRRRARFPKHLCRTLSRSFSLRSEIQF